MEVLKLLGVRWRGHELAAEGVLLTCLGSLHGVQRATAWYKPHMS
jgi:hypothetical protein